jgi:hypothetical protein
MGYDLRAKNEKAEDFHFGAFSFPILIEACGYLFSAISIGPRWCTAQPNPDPRMGEGYPMLLTNDGFPVTDEEAKIMARVARNFVAIQRGLPDNQPEQEKPMKIRKDFVDKFEKFAEWAESSGGFEIW